MPVLDKRDQEILRRLQGDLPLEDKPFQVIADDMGITEDSLLERVKDLKDSGVIRRLGAILHHRQSGIGGNAMVVWKVAECDMERIGQMFSQYQSVTHCYSRLSYPEWPFNLYTMIHSSDPKGCEEMAGEMSRRSGINQYLILHGTRELKKTSMNYIPPKRGDGL